MNLKTKVCVIEGCNSPFYCKDYCTKHYQRLLTHGDPLKTAREVIPRPKHGMRGTDTYKTWRAMLSRCYYENATAYPDYGGRGTTVCDRWRLDFNKFYEDMGDRPEGLSLDRINPHGNYEPSNCRWADASIQAFNQRMRKTNTSGHTGVSLLSSGKWQASIHYNNQQLRLGSFVDFDEAAHVRDSVAKQIYGFAAIDATLDRLKGTSA